MIPASERIHCIRTTPPLGAGPEWRTEKWMELGILNIPGARRFPEHCRKDRAWIRRCIAGEDWRARCERKRKMRARCRRIVIERARGRCAYCGLKVPDGRFEIDHIRPVRWGGRSNLWNLAACCWMCNNAKGQDVGWMPSSTRS